MVSPVRIGIWGGLLDGHRNSKSTTGEGILRHFHPKTLSRVVRVAAGEKCKREKQVMNKQDADEEENMG